MSDDEGSGTASNTKEKREKLFDKAPTTVKEVGSFLVKLNSKLEALGSNLNHELGTLRGSVEFMNESFEEFKKELAEARREISELKEEQKYLKHENSELSKQLQRTRAELTELQQYSRRNNLELKGIPTTDSESLTGIVSALATKVGAEITVNDIDLVHRVPTKDRNKSNIIVKFRSSDARDKLLESAKKTRLITSDLGISGSTSVFVNEHLCPEYKVLLARAIAAKKLHNWKYAWVSRGRILARKADNSDVIRISTEADLGLIV